MGKQFILQSQSRENLLADLAKYLREGCTLVPGSFFALPPAAKYEAVPIAWYGIATAVPYYGPELPVQLSEGDQPAIFGAVVELTDDWEERRLRAKYANTTLRQVCTFPDLTDSGAVGDRRFFELVKDWNVYAVVTGEHDHLSPRNLQRLHELLNAQFNNGKLTDLKELAEKHLGL